MNLYVLHTKWCNSNCDDDDAFVECHAIFQCYNLNLSSLRIYIIWAPDMPSYFCNLNIIAFTLALDGKGPHFFYYLLISPQGNFATDPRKYFP